MNDKTNLLTPNEIAQLNKLSKRDSDIGSEILLLRLERSGVVRKMNKILDDRQ